MKIFRIQNKKGEGPFSYRVIPNENHKYIEHDQELVRELKERFGIDKRDDLPEGWVFGCGSKEELLEWFGESINMLSRAGFMIFKGDVAGGDYYISGNQVIFNRKKAKLRVDLIPGDDIEDVAWANGEDGFGKGYLKEQIEDLKNLSKI